MELDPEADPNCKRCGGTGVCEVSGNICFGMGAKPVWGECWCILYKKLGMDPNGKKKK